MSDFLTDSDISQLIYRIRLFLHNFDNGVITNMIRWRKQKKKRPTFIISWEKWRHRTLPHQHRALRDKTQASVLQNETLRFYQQLDDFCLKRWLSDDCRELTDRDISLPMIFSRTILPYHESPARVIERLYLSARASDTLIELNTYTLVSRVRNA